MTDQPTTLRRRLLRLVPVLGVRVMDLTSGVSVLSRSPNTRSRRLLPGSYLVQTGRKADLEVTEVGEETVLVNRPGRTWRQIMTTLVQTGRKADLEVTEVGEDMVLINRPGGNWRQVMTTERWLIQSLVPRVLMAHFERYGVNCVLDVGANKGQYARRLRQAGYTGRIISFEPVPEEVARLQAAAEGDPSWTVHPIALGSSDGTLEMYVVPGTLSSPLPATDFGGRRFPKLRTTERHEVPVRRLEDLLDELLDGLSEPRPFLKMDTQGYDVEVFRGLGKRAGDFVGLQSEVALMRLYEGMPRMAESLAVYEEAGYEVSGMYPVNREDDSGRVLEFDCIMVRADALDGR